MKSTLNETRRAEARTTCTLKTLLEREVSLTTTLDREDGKHMYRIEAIDNALEEKK